MPLILNIDTATTHASVGFSKDGVLLDMIVNIAQKEHASFLQPAIAELSSRLDILLGSIDAIALTIGPGSYTGLRVGLSSAKGLAYALNKPLVPINTLEVMAHAALKEAQNGAGSSTSNNNDIKPELHFCPMIDARREEVFTGIYDHQLKEIMSPRALVLSPEIFAPYMENNILIFSGDGAVKWKVAYQGNNALFSGAQHSVADLAPLAEKRLILGDLPALAYLEPLYLKEFHKN
jgi:tRNA threonylcarbamoyladenosine biosynthesis protein TsaB